MRIDSFTHVLGHTTKYGKAGDLTNNASSSLRPAQKLVDGLSADPKLAADLASGQFAAVDYSLDISHRHFEIGGCLFKRQSHRAQNLQLYPIAGVG